MRTYVASLETNLIVQVPPELVRKTLLLIDRGAVAYYEVTGSEVILHGAGISYCVRQFGKGRVIVAVEGAFTKEVVRLGHIIKYNFQPFRFRKEGLKAVIIILREFADPAVEMIDMDKEDALGILKKAGEAIKYAKSAITLLFHNGKLLTMTIAHPGEVVLCVNMLEAVGDKTEEKIIMDMITGFASYMMMLERRGMSYVPDKSN